VVARLGRQTGRPQGGHPTLLLPRGTRGFVDPENGAVRLHTVLIPSITGPGRTPRCARRHGCAGRWRCPTSRCAWCTSGTRATCLRFEFETATTFEVTREARSGDVVDEILAAAAGCQADLIAMATAGHQGFLDVLRGSTTERVLRNAPCPMLAVPAD
jgi:hypothetical protein